MWNRIRREYGSSLEKLATQDPQMGLEKARTKSEVASIPQSGIWKTGICSSGIPRFTGDENPKTSLPVVMLGVTVKRYTTVSMHFSALGISISMQREMCPNT